MNRDGNPAVEAIADRPDVLPGGSGAPQLRHRLLALLLVGAFAAVQYRWWVDGRRYRLWWDPRPVLGPLYFLVNERADDDWLGFVLLAVLVPCILAFAVWSTRLTAVLVTRRTYPPA
jgi:hypothetical protein